MAYDHLRPVVAIGGLIQSLFVRVDRVPAEGETVLGHDFKEPRDGGKAANVAVAARRLGAPVGLVTLVGDDERGILWRELLESEGVDTSWVDTRAGPTDVGMALMTPSKVPALISVCRMSLEMSPEWIQRATPMIERASVVVASLECTFDAVLKAFEIGRTGTALTVLNLSPVMALPDGLFDLTDVLVVNEHEAAELTGLDGADRRAMAQRMTDSFGTPNIIVTAGPDGAFLVRDGRSVEHHEAPTVEVVDTTGAGDAFLGALAARLREGDGLSAATEFALVAAGLSVTKEGTIPSYVKLSELE